MVVIPPPQPEKPSTSIQQTKGPTSTIAGTQEVDKEKHKKRKEKQKKEHHRQPSKVQIRFKDASSLTETYLGQLLKTLESEAKTRSEQRNKELKDKNVEQIKFLNKCRNLA